MLINSWPRAWFVLLSKKNPLHNFRLQHMCVRVCMCRDCLRQSVCVCVCVFGGCRSIKTKSLYEPAILILISFGCLEKTSCSNKQTINILLYILMIIHKRYEM